MYRFRDFLTLSTEKELQEGHPLPFLYSDSLNLLDDVTKSKKAQVVVQIDATYSGYLLNSRVYPGKFMRDKRSWGTWVSQERGGLATYDKPVLTHHQQTDGDPIGRVVRAEYVQLWGDETRFMSDYKEPASRYDAGSGKIIIDAAIMDPDAQMRILDGRYRTVSSGQTSSDAWCSICGHNIGRTQEFCKHFPGDRYEIEVEGTDETKVVVMYLITGMLDYHEVSFVNIPGNALAQVVSFSEVEDSLRKVETEIKVPHAESFGVGTFDRYARVALVDSEGRTTDLIRPEGAEDTIPYTRKNIRTATAVSFVDLDLPASKVDPEEPKGQEDTAFAQAKDANSGGISHVLSRGTEMDKDKDKGSTVPDPAVSKDQDKAPTTAEKVQKNLTDQIDQLKEQISELQSQVDTQKGQLDSRTEELASSREAHRISLAQQLAFSRVVTGHLDASKLEGIEDFQTLVDSYAERTVESLQDAVQDAIPEVQSRVAKLTDNKSTFLFDQDRGDEPVAKRQDKTNVKDVKKEESADSDEPTSDDLNNL